MEGARRIDEWSRIEKRVPHVGVVPHLTTAPDQGGGTLDFLPAEWEVLAMIDATRDVRAIARELGRSDFDIAKTLFGLESAGVVVLVDSGPAPRQRPPTAAELTELVARAEGSLARHDHEGARATAERAIALYPEEAGAHLLLGRIHLAATRPLDAVNALRQALRLDPLLVQAYRLLGHALVAGGRFGEAVEQWEHWERLAPHVDTEAARLEEVRRAKAAAQTLGQTGAAGHV
jgi:cytochrome c-type biogenesis protein CcmH/NrfG